ncbi:MAG: ATP-binding protein [Actinomycetota bacterium]|nr:ATP-binding protein [Actinomycetota bacterium]
MPLTGGATDKLGGRYETLWTVFCMLDVMDDRAESVRLEPPGEEGEGVEFRIRRGNSREYHQVKRQHGAEGRWTLNELGSRMVLSSFMNKLNDPATLCAFVSSHPAYQLSELAERARGAEFWDEFEREFLAPQRQSRDFAMLCSLWGNSPREEAFERLRRIHVRTMDERSLSEIVEVRLQALVDGNPSTASDVLFRLVLDRVHEEVTAYEMWRRLEERGLQRRDWANDTHVLARLDEANARYLSPIRNELISGASIPREGTRAALTSLASQNGRRGVLLSGEAGVGKSGVVLQVLEELHEKKIPVLAFRVDRLDPTSLPNDIGKQLDLPGSPVAVLGGVAQGRNCVLVIDQLDAVSLASGRHPQFFDGVDELIRQAEAYPRMRLLVACRNFDLENDHRLRRLANDRGVLDECCEV